MRARYRRRRDALVEALSPFDVGISGLAAGVNMLLTLPDGAEPEVLRRAGEAGIALSGLGLMRHPDAGADVPEQDGVIIGFAAPAEHAFGRRSTRCATSWTPVAWHSRRVRAALRSGHRRVVCRNGYGRDAG